MMTSYLDFKEQNLRELRVLFQRKFEVNRLKNFCLDFSSELPSSLGLKSDAWCKVIRAGSKVHVKYEIDF